MTSLERQVFFIGLGLVLLAVFCWFNRYEVSMLDGRLTALERKHKHDIQTIDARTSGQSH